MNRIVDGLSWLAGQFSCERHEFARAMQPAGEMLLEGIYSKGYAIHKGGRYALSDAGQRCLANQAQEQES